MKKVLFLLTVLIVLSLAFSVTALAVTETDGQSSEESQTPLGEHEASNTFTEIYAIARENADSIFSALSFIFSVMLVFAYRKGLIPVMNAGISAIKKSSADLEAKTLDSIEKTEKSISMLKEEFGDCKSCVNSVLESTDALSERLCAIEKERIDTANVEAVMLSQIDMLYEILINSSLPQYTKDRIGEKVSEMKKSVKVGEDNGTR